jgi:hypothetical protein
MWNVTMSPSTITTGVGVVAGSADTYSNRSSIQNAHDSSKLFKCCREGFSRLFQLAGQVLTSVAATAAAPDKLLLLSLLLLLHGTWQLLQARKPVLQ